MNQLRHSLSNFLAFACISSLQLLITTACPANASPIPENREKTSQHMTKKEAGTLEVNLSGTDLYNALVKEVGRDVESRIQQQNQEYLRSLTGIASAILALAAFTGIRSFSDFRKKVTDDLKEQLQNSDLIQAIIEKTIKENITSDINKRLAVVSNELSFYRLSNLAGALAAGQGFSNNERDAAIESLEQLSNDNSITNRKEFSIVLEKIIDAFFSADLDFQIDSIEEMFSNVITESDGIVKSLIQHYGWKALGDADDDANTVKRFHKYVDACKKLRLYERALPYMLVFEHQSQREGWEKRIESLFQDLECLGKQEKEVFCRTMMINSDITKVCNTPTGKTLRLTKAFQDFNVAYKERLSLLNKFSSDPISPESA